MCPYDIKCKGLGAMSCVFMIPTNQSTVSGGLPTNERGALLCLQEALELVPRHGGGQRAVAVLLAHQEEEGGTHRDGPAVLQLLQAQAGRHVVVRGVVPHPPPHVHWLELNTVLVSATNITLLKSDKLTIQYLQ